MPSAETFHQHLERLKTQIESELAEALASREWPPSLTEAVRYSLMAGGKRLRPLLVLMSTELCGGTIADALPAACAIEMIHTYSLIHDDLPAMDNDDFRRGRLTSHKVFGDALAILAGDCLLTLAFEILGQGELESRQRTELVVTLARAAGGSGMVGGQVLDLEAERGSFLFQSVAESDRTASPDQAVSDEGGSGLNSGGARRSAPSSGQASSRNLPDRVEDSSNSLVQNRVDHLTQIHTMKTGALIAAAVELGAICAGAGPEHRARLKHYGRNIGLAFQITDDLLDVTGDRTRLGKVPGRDADLGKLTYVALLGIEQSRQRARELVDEACQMVDGLGVGQTWLRDLARFIVERDH